MTNPVRVRFAPSPTGGLHLGGVRTILFNYLFAKKHNGKFILRIEDTDQTRYVEGAEDYILECLKWVNMLPDEGPHIGGPFEPYRQSERKPIYKKYAEQLVSQGNAYYAFDTSSELEAMRENRKTEGNSSSQYDYSIRMQMKNSLSMPSNEVEEWLKSGKPYVVRIKMPENETVSFNDMIRGEVTFQTNLSDDKVLLKADGMPTYHLAVVVDDYLMQITHAFRGEEWLPSAPVHLLLWKYLGWEDKMPQWAHLPLILKPDGNGKLSKRDGDRLGFPVYAMNWYDPKSGDTTVGFRERGFLPEAFVNILAMLGWNSGTDQEIFSIDELIQLFSIDRVNHAGAKFDYEKAKWFNQQYIAHSSNERLFPLVQADLKEKGIYRSEEWVLAFIQLMKERVILVSDFIEKGSYIFDIQHYDIDQIKKRWSEDKKILLQKLIHQYESANFIATELEQLTKDFMSTENVKPGDILPLLRLSLAGTMQGPAVFDMMQLLGKEDTLHRFQKSIAYFDSLF